ncbi:MAG: hypothetical protein H7263_02410 [Candidatus Sericytochromatia bacterium]|nr:hypothetical protein [Candidatus Sericytochromatia bacterium]
MDNVPYIFKPLILRSKVKFCNLKNHLFTPEEIMWLCKETENNNLNWEYHRVSPISISKRYNINLEGFKLWILNYKSDAHCFISDELCEQPVLDGISARRLTNIFNQHDISSIELDIIMNDEIIKSASRRSKKIHGHYEKKTRAPTKF